MSAASNYWHLCRLNQQGQCKIEAQPLAEAFFKRQFPDLGDQAEVQDAGVQRRLIEYFKQGTRENSKAAECCLRCFLSHHILRVCIDLERRFGRRYGFTRDHLCPLVLNDTLADCQWGDRPRLEGASRGQLQPLALEILTSFDPGKSGLATWATYRVKAYPSLKFFLQEHGILQLTDWAILNDTKPEQLDRILMDFHGQTESESLAARCLLSSYHQVYRRDRLRQLARVSSQKCPPPSREQLREIGDRLESAAHAQSLTGEETMARLQTLAAQLRQYRIYRQTGMRAMDSLDTPKYQARLDQLQQTATAATSGGEQDQNEFLTGYWQQFVACLDQAIAQVLAQKRKQWSHHPQKVDQYLTVLRLFHCEGVPMGEIATQVGLQHQYQVSRLVKLKQLRTDIQHRMLPLLRERTITLAAQYTHPERLLQLENQIRVALAEQIAAEMQEAAIAANQPRPTSPTSLFARQLCRYLEDCSGHDQ